MDISGRVALVTGASSGIGLATARLFAERGARVALAARSADVLERLAHELPDALAIPTDVRDIAAVRRMVELAASHYGRLDILVNNAGEGMHVPVAEADLDQYRALLDLNVIGPLAAMQAVIPIMRRQPDGGVIVNVSSGLSKRIVPRVGPYASTKYTLNALSLTARVELAPERIRVCLVYPGVTATNFKRHTGQPASAGQVAGALALPLDTAEHVAEKLLEAVRTEAAETYANSIRPETAAKE